MTEKFFVLHNELDIEVTRPVCDMAAFFGYIMAVEGTASLTVTYAEGSFVLELAAGERSFTASQACSLDAAGGEITRCLKLATVDVFSQMAGERPAMPWGVLTGVRPGKLAHKLLDGGVAPQELPAYLKQRYLLPEAQAKLLTEITLRQKALLPDATRFTDAGIYIGVPFCPSRCSYCSFPAGIVPADEESQQNFVNLIELDILNVVKLLSMHSLCIRSLYIGGGTPTSLNDKVFANLLKVVDKHLHFDTLQEFTVEAGRPDCFSTAKLAAMEAAGVNRISVNPQTLHDKTLALIGRRHTVADFYRAYEEVRKSTIPNVNVDLIIGLPGETATDIAYSLQAAAALEPENLTIHTLTWKKGTALFGEAMNLPALEAATLVEQGRCLAADKGLAPYYMYRQHYMLGHLANIGYAKPGTESIYNIQMMEERHPVIGIGPSSASKVPLADGHHLLRLNMPKNVAVYRQNLASYFAKRQELFD